MFYAIDKHVKPLFHSYEQSFFSSLTPPQPPFTLGLSIKRDIKQKEY